MKINTAFLVLSFFAAIALIVVSDIPLQGMLGEHPLQSELSFVEGHVKEIEKNQNLPGKPKEELKKNSTQDELLYIEILVVSLLLIFLSVLGIWQLYLGRKSLKNSEIKSNNSKLLGLTNMMICCGVFFIASGSIYILEGRAGAAEIQKPWDEAQLRKKQNLLSNQENVNRTKLLNQVYQNDKDRQNKGLIFVVFGMLSLLAAIGSSHFKKISNST